MPRSRRRWAGPTPLAMPLMFSSKRISPQGEQLPFHEIGPTSEALRPQHMQCCRRLSGIESSTDLSDTPFSFSGGYRTYPPETIDSGSDSTYRRSHMNRVSNPTTREVIL